MESFDPHVMCMRIGATNLHAMAESAQLALALSVACNSARRFSS
jgi:hypothetical protein